MISSLVDTWDSLGPLKAQVVAFTLTTFAALVAYLLRSRVRIVWGNTTNSFHKINIPDNQVASIYTEKFYIQNTGKSSADHVNVIFNKPPTEISVYPARAYERKMVNDQAFQITLEYISPGELIIIDTIDINTNLTTLEFVSCKESSGRRVAWWVNRKFSAKIYTLFAFLMFFGVVYALQLGIRLVMTVMFGQQL